MGYGDEIIATGLARGLRDRGKLAAFGDGSRIIWGPWCEEMFANNPNIARPGCEERKDLEWIGHYKGGRKYNKMVNGKWVWNYDFKVTPGQFYFSEEEEKLATGTPRGYILVEPNVPWQKKVAPNKDWGEANYEELSRRLKKEIGRDLVQFIHKQSRRKLEDTVHLSFQKFRDAISFMRNASLYVGPEGGLHHAAAALGIKAVVLFGGFIPPAVTGYDFHTNLTGGAKACGNIETCAHCKKAMNNISIDEVLAACQARLV